jgi:uncharacterized OB-fold protein
MMSHIVDSNFDDIAIGKRVKLVMKPTAGEEKLPCFALA